MTEQMSKPLSSSPLDDQFTDHKTSTRTVISANVQRQVSERGFIIPAPPIPGTTRWCLSDK
jgi:hypothetical protein